MVVGVGPGRRAKQTKYSLFIAQKTLRTVHKSISLCPVHMKWEGEGCVQVGVCGWLCVCLAM